MDLRLLISLALCCMTWKGEARPQQLELLDEARVQEAISKLKLLNSMSPSNQHSELIAEEPGPPSFRTKHKKSNKQYQRDSIMAPLRDPSTPSLPSLPALPHIFKSRYLKPLKVYSDGAFSDIPSDAFQLEHRKEFQPDADRDSHTHRSPHAHRDEQPDSLMRTCLNYFQGRSNPEPSALELILSICNELLDDNNVEEFALDDEERQQMYHFRANEYGRGTPHQHSLGPGVTVECDLCPHGHHLMKLAMRNDNDDGEEDVESETSLSDLLKLFKPYGSRRETRTILMKE